MDDAEWQQLELGLPSRKERKVCYDDYDDDAAAAAPEQQLQQTGKWLRSSVDVKQDCNLSLDDSVLEKLELSEFETLEREFEKLADTMKPPRASQRPHQRQRPHQNANGISHAASKRETQTLEDASPRKTAPTRTAAVEIESNLEVEDESIGWLRNYGKLYAEDDASKSKTLKEAAPAAVPASKQSSLRYKTRDDREEEVESASEAQSESESGSESESDLGSQSGRGKHTLRSTDDDSGKKLRLATAADGELSIGSKLNTSFSQVQPAQGAAFDDDESWSASPKFGRFDEKETRTKVKFDLGFSKDRLNDSVLSEASVRRQTLLDKVNETKDSAAPGRQPDSADRATKSAFLDSLFSGESSSEAGARTQQLSALLTEKLAQLEAEIDKFRRENASLARLKAERAEQLRALQRQAEQLERHKAEVDSNFTDAVRQEVSRARRERKMYETMQSRLKAELEKTADERRELESVRAELRSLREESRAADERWQRSVARLQSRCSDLESQNATLREEVATLDRLRLANLATSQVQSPAKPIRANAAKSAAKSSVLPNYRVEKMVDDDRDRSFDDAEVASASASAPAPRLDLEVLDRNGNRSRKIPAAEEQGNLYEELLADTLRACVIDPRLRNDGKSVRETQHPDGRVERVFSDGSRELVYTNGTRKEMSADSRRYVIRFLNGDLKKVDSDGRVVYLYNEARTLHTTFPDGLEMLHFPNGQTEVHYSNGSKEVRFADGAVRYVSPSGIEETILRDGTVVRLSPNGDKLIVAPNGQRELHTSAFKRRDYPDGTTKTVFTDGRQETRYSSGRVRVKDSHGNIIFDRKVDESGSAAAANAQLAV